MNTNPDSFTGWPGPPQAGTPYEVQGREFLSRAVNLTVADFEHLPETEALELLHSHARVALYTLRGLLDDPQSGITEELASTVLGWVSTLPLGRDSVLAGVEHNLHRRFPAVQ